MSNKYLLKTSKQSNEAEGNIRACFCVIFFDPCYSKYGLQVSSFIITWQLAGNAEPHAPPRPTESDSDFKKIPR